MSTHQVTEAELAMRIVKVLLDDLQGRFGLGHEWEQSDRDVQRELQATWRRLVRQEVTGAVAAAGYGGQARIKTRIDLRDLARVTRDTAAALGLTQWDSESRRNLQAALRVLTAHLLTMAQSLEPEAAPAAPDADKTEGT